MFKMLNVAMWRMLWFSPKCDRMFNYQHWRNKDYLSILMSHLIKICKMWSLGEYMLRFMILDIVMQLILINLKNQLCWKVSLQFFQIINYYVQLNYKDYLNKNSELFGYSTGINCTTHWLKMFIGLFTEGTLIHACFCITYTS